MHADVSPLGLVEMVTLQPSDPRWGAPRTNLDAYWEAYQLAQWWDSRSWMMWRFTRRL